MRGGGTDGDERAEDGIDTGEATPGLDEFHRLLATESRRRVLYYLLEHPVTPLEELSDVVAGWKAVQEDAVVGPRERHRIGMTLHHRDVPRLADRDVVTYDRERREVALEPLPEPLSDIVRRTRAYEGEVDEDGSEDDGRRP